MMDINYRKDKIKFEISKEWLNVAIIGIMFILATVHYSFFFENLNTAGHLCNIFLALAMVYLFTTRYYYFPAILILFGNNSLGNVFFGNIQFVYLGFVMMMLLVIYKLSKGYRVNTRLAFFTLIFLLNLVNLYIFNDTNLRTIIHDLMYFIMVFVVVSDLKSEGNSFEPIFLACALSVFVSAIQAAFFGGIPYFEDGNLTRYGVMGAAAGDPNFAGFYLLIGFFSLLCYCPSVKWIFKIPIMAIIVIAVYRTGSATTMGLFLLILGFYILSSLKINKAIKFAVVAVIVLFVLIIFSGDFLDVVGLNGTPVGRFLEKISQVISGDYSEATTGRSGLAGQYIEYYVNQPILKIFLGGNPVKIPGIFFAGYELVSHNTYVDLFVRFGAIVAIAIIAFMIIKLISAAKNVIVNKTDTEHFYLKLLVMMFIFTISVYYSTMFIISFMLLFMLDTNNKPNKIKERV